MNLIQVAKELGTDEQCLDYLERQRWPEGVRCPICGGDKVSRITRQSASKNKRNRIYQCLDLGCHQQFSATAGTIFHDSHLPLTKWFMALALITNAKKGISAKQVQRDLKVGYQTAWYLCHRIRKAMEENGGELLKGTVEIDETYVGGKARRKQIRREGKYKIKDCVIGMVERGGKVRFRHLGKGSATSDAIGPIIEANVSQDVERIMTDESPIYPFALSKELLARHNAIAHRYEYVRGDIHTNTIESAFSLLKRGIVGQFHKVSIRHLPRYLAEFEYRFNRRDEQEEMFGETVRRMVKTDKMPFRQLVLEAQRGNSEIQLEPMSSLIFQTEQKQVTVATDTLATSPDGKPFKFTTKAFIVPHLRMIIAGTGAGGFLGRWFVRVNDGLVVKGIDNLDFHAPSVLRSLWRGYKQDFSVPDITTTIYHFGFSETTGFIHSYAYRSTGDFASCRLEPYGLGVKPPCSVPDNYSLPNVFLTIMDEQRRVEATKKADERVYIGGEIQVHHLFEPGFEVYTLHRFEDYARDETAIYDNFHTSKKAGG